MHHNPFDTLQRANLAQHLENQRLREQLAESKRLLREVINPNLGAVGRMSLWLECAIHDFLNNKDEQK